MKLRTLERFEDAVSGESAWRRKELTTLRIETLHARPHTEAMLIRSGTALLYAHWEGFVKKAGQLYVEYVSQKKLSYEQLSTPLFGLALKSRINALLEAKSSSIHVDFARVIRDDLSSRAPLRPELIDMGANLSSTRFKDVVQRLGLPYSHYELREHLIDVRLLDARNGIAHGKATMADRSDFLDLHSRVEQLICGLPR